MSLHTVETIVNVKESASLARAIAAELALPRNEPDISKWATEYEPGITPVEDKSGETTRDEDD